MPGRTNAPSCNSIDYTHTQAHVRNTAKAGSGKWQAALVPLMAGRTTVVVAHRLSTVRHCDTIAVLESGRILEQGRHADLMLNADGPYSQLVRHTQR